MGLRAADQPAGDEPRSRELPSEHDPSGKQRPEDDELRSCRFLPFSDIHRTENLDQRPFVALLDKMSPGFGIFKVENVDGKYPARGIIVHPMPCRGWL